MSTVKVAEWDPESAYQPTCINVESPKWEKFGFTLIGGSTVVMLLGALGIGSPGVWKQADDISTVLFTLELFIRIFEKGYLFCSEAEKNWNFFDSLVVAISIFSMIIAAKADQGSSGSSSGDGGSSANSSTMNKMKALRTLRLLRLLRLFRIFRGIEKVQLYVDSALNKVAICFITVIVVIAAACLFVTVGTAIWAAATAWLREHSIPKLPKIE